MVPHGDAHKQASAYTHIRGVGPSPTVTRNDSSFRERVPLGSAMGEWPPHNTRLFFSAFVGRHRRGSPRWAEGLQAPATDGQRRQAELPLLDPIPKGLNRGVRGQHACVGRFHRRKLTQRPTHRGFQVYEAGCRLLAQGTPSAGTSRLTDQKWMSSFRRRIPTPPPQDGDLSLPASDVNASTGEQSTFGEIASGDRRWLAFGGV